MSTKPSLTRLSPFVGDFFSSLGFVFQKADFFRNLYQSAAG